MKILAFAGSTRTQSINKKLIKIAAEGARKAGAEVTIIDLRDFPMPLYDGDLEAEKGLPENALKLKKIFNEHKGLLLSCPEYNSSITGVLKNTIDWISRSAPGQKKDLEEFDGKVVGLLSASPGALGGLRGLVHVRVILGNIGCLVLPGQMALPKAADAFNPDGSMKDAKIQARAESVGASVAEMLKKLQ